MISLEVCSGGPVESESVRSSTENNLVRYERDQQLSHQFQLHSGHQHTNEAINRNYQIKESSSLLPTSSQHSDINAMHHMHSHSVPVVTHLVNGYPHYIHSANQHFDDNKDDASKKRKRTNYKDPENSSKLNAALNALINQQDGEGQKDLKTVSKLYNLPYNTLRDNFLK